MAHPRRDLVAGEIERLKIEKDKLEREWRRLPFLMLSFALVPLVYLIWGALAALYVFLFVPGLFFTAAYLVGVRRRENSESIGELESQVERWDADDVSLRSE